MSEMNEENLEAKQAKEDTEQVSSSEENSEENVTELKSEGAKADEGESEQEGAQDSKTEDVDYKQKYFYLAAEMDNMRKRFDREKQNLLKFGSEKILSDLVEVVDNLDRTLDAIKNDTDEKIKNIVVGVDMVHKQFIEALKDNGLERIEALGEKFDPNFHEAMAQQPSEEEEDTVINEYQKGYVLNGRLLRPAKVIVAKKND